MKPQITFPTPHIPTAIPTMPVFFARLTSTKFDIVILFRSQTKGDSWRFVEHASVNRLAGNAVSHLLSSHPITFSWYANEYWLMFTSVLYLEGRTVTKKQGYTQGEGVVNKVFCNRRLRHHDQPLNLLDMNKITTTKRFFESFAAIKCIC